MIETELDKIKLTQKIIKDPRNKFGYQPDSLWINEDNEYEYETHIVIWGTDKRGVHDSNKHEVLYLTEEKQANGHIIYWFRVAPGDWKIRVRTAGDLQRLMDVFRIGRDLIV